MRAKSLLRARGAVERLRRAYCVVRFAWGLSRGEKAARAWDILTEPRTCDLLATCRAEVVRRADAMESPCRETLIKSARAWDALPNFGTASAALVLAVALAGCGAPAPDRARLDYVGHRADLFHCETECGECDLCLTPVGDAGECDMYPSLPAGGAR